MRWPSHRSTRTHDDGLPRRLLPQVPSLAPKHSPRAQGGGDGLPRKRDAALTHGGTDDQRLTTSTRVATKSLASSDSGNACGLGGGHHGLPGGRDLERVEGRISDDHRRAKRGIGERGPRGADTDLGDGELESVAARNVSRRPVRRPVGHAKRDGFGHLGLSGDGGPLRGGCDGAGSGQESGAPQEHRLIFVAMRWAPHAVIREQV